MDRRQIYSALSNQLTKLTDDKLLALLETAKPLHTGIESKSFELMFGEQRVLVKKIPLSDLDTAPENVHYFRALANAPGGIHSDRLMQDSAVDSPKRSI